MYEEQDLDLDTIGKTQKNKKYVKIIVIVSVIVALAIVGALFFTLYGKDDETANSSEGNVVSETVSESSVASVESISDDLSEEISGEIISEVASGEASEESVDASEESSEEVSEEPEHGWVINSMGYTYLYQGKGYNQFNGTSSTAGKYAAALNEFVQSVSFPVYSMIAPTAVEFVEIPYDVKQSDDFYNSSQKNFISNSYEAFKGTGIDIYSSISSKAKEEYLYFRTDKNWTADAAYLAYVDFCSATGNIPAAKTGYELGSYNGYLGNFYNATSSMKLKANADVVNYYRVNVSFPCTVNMYSGNLVYKDRALIYTQLTNPTSFGYYAFLGDRGESFTITSQNSATEKSILVIGDSSAFPFVPFLAANYRNIYFINAEAYKGNVQSYISDKTIDEAVVLSYATSATTSSYVSKLGDMFKTVAEPSPEQSSESEPSNS